MYKIIEDSKQIQNTCNIIQTGKVTARSMYRIINNKKNYDRQQQLTTTDFQPTAKNIHNWRGKHFEGAHTSS